MKETKFKMTEIGLIPQDWEVKLLGKIGAFSKGKGISRSESNSGKNPAIRYGELYTKHNNVISEFGSYISNDVALTSKQLKYGDILFAASGETKEEIGKSAAFVSTCESYAGGDIIICSPFFTESSLFLGFALNYPLVQKQKAMFGQGDAIVHITTDNLKKVKLIYPPLFEQTRIASALSEVDALLTSIDKVIAKKQAIKEGTMQQLLTGKTRLEGFTEEWKEKTIGDLGAIQKGSVLPYLTPIKDFVEYSMPAFDDDKTPCNCKGSTMASSRIPISGKVLLINKLNVRQKRIWLVNAQSDNSVCSGEFVPFETSNFSAEYLLYLLLTRSVVQEWSDNSTGTSNSQKRVTPSYILEYKVRVPQDIHEQQAIASILTSMDSELSDLQAKRKKYEAIKQGMMQQLLTGKVRLI